MTLFCFQYQIFTQIKNKFFDLKCCWKQAWTKQVWTGTYFNLQTCC